MRKSPELFDRDHEWAELDNFSTNPSVGATLGLVYGRRRQGKTMLLELLAEGTRGLYFSGLEQSATQNLVHLGDGIGRFQGIGAPIRLESWTAAVDTLLKLGDGRQPLPVVLDEFPYLVAGAPELPSIIQAALSPRGYARRHSHVRLILCGSAFSVMRGLLGGTAPLRGRATLELVVNPFDYRAAADFWGLSGQWELAFRVNALCGGTPAYRDFCAGSLPTTMANFDNWVKHTLLNPATALFREGRVLVADEPQIGDTALYLSILAAIAKGSTRISQIAAALGRKETSLSRPLATLEDTFLTRRVSDPLRQRRSTHRIAEPMLRLHQLIIGPHEALLLRHMGETVWTETASTVASNIYGSHFEDLAREWTQAHASPETLGSRPREVGRTEIPCPKHRVNHEVDVVAVAGKDVIAIGEAKSGGKQVGTDELDRLVHIRELLPRAAHARLLLFARKGFTKNLILRAKHNPSVQLIDLERLYAGT